MAPMWDGGKAFIGDGLPVPGLYTPPLGVMIVAFLQTLIVFCHIRDPQATLYMMRLRHVSGRLWVCV